MSWIKAGNDIKMRLKGSIKRLEMPFKSEPGPVAVYKERKHSHVLCVVGGISVYGTV